MKRKLFDQATQVTCTMVRFLTASVLSLISFNLSVAETGINCNGSALCGYLLDGSAKNLTQQIAKIDDNKW